jgi:signal transduction histidine kinase
MLQNRINALSYAGYGACIVLFFMAYMAYVEPAKPELNAAIGIILAVTFASVITFLGRKLSRAISDSGSNDSDEAYKKQYSKIAHDVRNSLAVIKMDAEAALLREDLAPEIRETFIQLDAEADKINSILS